MVVHISALTEWPSNYIIHRIFEPLRILALHNQETINTFCLPSNNPYINVHCNEVLEVHFWTLFWESKLGKGSADGMILEMVNWFVN